jgi:DNA-binding transcriptional MerR regulator
MPDSDHIYNLKAVMQEVGINAATLRAWERRYDLPKPQRSPGGHRLYSRQDIEMLNWLVARQAEGLSISHAIELWKAQHEPGHNNTLLMESATAATGMGDDVHSALRERWISACAAFDDVSANHILDQAFALAAPETICAEVLQKGLAQIGEGWYSGSISVQQEHFATSIANRRIGSLLAAEAPPTRQGHILMACPPGEAHDFVMLMLTYLLRRQGWQAVYLGANVPLVNLDTTIKLIKPRLVVSAVQTLDGAASLRQMSEYLASLNIPLAFGGGVFLQVPEAIAHISGYYLGRDLATGAMQIEKIVSVPTKMPTAGPISLRYIIALKQFIQYEVGIGAHVRALLQDARIEPEHLQIAIDHLTQLISSALQLGDIHLMDPSIGWLNGLLEKRGISPSITGYFYAAYDGAVEKYLGGEGAIIREWFATLSLAQVKQ